MSSQGTHKRHLWLVAAAGFALVMTSPNARAEPGDPFSPEFYVCTDVSSCQATILNEESAGDIGVLFIPKTFSGTTEAGAYPKLTTGVRKSELNGCRPGTEMTRVGYGDMYSYCRPGDYYQEQDVMKIVTHLPPGLVLDINAAPYCDARERWLFIDSWSGGTERKVWACANSQSAVGAIYTTNQRCNRKINEERPGPDPLATDGCISLAYFFSEPDLRIDTRQVGVIYNERPGPGEQGHLVVLWPGVPSAPDDYSTQAARSDVSVRVLGDGTVETVADDIPDRLCRMDRSPGSDSTGTPFCRTGAQNYEIFSVLDGTIGQERGHPLLTNPTDCAPREAEAEFQGYGFNSRDLPLGPGGTPSPGRGTGRAASDSAPYRVTGCDRVPFDPRLTMRLDGQSPEGVPAISSTVTQASLGEATTQEVEVRFPRAFKVNDRNTATRCSDDLLEASEEESEDRCPDSSKIGEVVAESRLLPEGQKLKGNVYLAGLTGGSIKVASFLRGKADLDRGFIDFNLRMDAEGEVEDDLVLKIVFRNLPQIPISRFNLKLFGGEKGLIKNPRVCTAKPEEIVADFKSHSGKTKRNTVPVEIKGCSDPQLDVELSNRRKGELTNLGLSVGFPGTAIGQVEFRLARQLKWGYRKRLSPRVDKRVKGKRLKRLKSAGTVAFATAQGERKVRIKAKRTKWGNLGFTPLIRKNREGQVVAAQVSGFSASLFRTTHRRPAAAGAENAKTARKGKSKRKRTKRKKPRRQSHMTLAGLPGEDLTAVELSLRGRDRRRKFFIRNPTGCKRPLNFVAIVTTTDGRRLALRDEVKLRGKGCRKKERGSKRN